MTNSLDELTQCLHYATVHGLNDVLLLIGDRSATMIKGVFIRFDDATKSTRKRFLSIACENGLNWTCEHPDDAPEHLEHLLKNVIGAAKSDIVAEVKLY